MISSSGESILLEFSSDCGITDAGWEIEWSTIIGDGIGDELAPVTLIDADESWYTEVFSVLYEDADDSLG